VGVVQGFRAAGWEVTVISNDALPVPPGMVQFVPVPQLRWWSNFPEVQELGQMLVLAWLGWRALQGRRPALIYQRAGGLNLAGLTLSRLLQAPLILEYNSSDAQRARLWGERRYRLAGLLEQVERVGVERADVVSAISEVLAGELAARLPSSRGRLVVNPNGVDPAKFHPAVDGRAVRSRLEIPNGRVVLGFSGTFMPYQGLRVLAHALMELAASGRLQGLHVLLLGAGGARSELEPALADPEIRSRVSMPGAVPFAEIEMYLAACDILISPHALPEIPGLQFYWSPIKVFEYMAMGRAIVASRLGQIAEILEHEVDALLVPAGEPKALADAIDRLAADPELRRRLGAAARRKVVERFTWKLNVERALASLVEGAAAR
jgi:glycosyltransferase involved in cell wall biosynthesis